MKLQTSYRVPGDVKAEVHRRTFEGNDCDELRTEVEAAKSARCIVLRVMVDRD